MAGYYDSWSKRHHVANVLRNRAHSNTQWGVPISPKLGTAVISQRLDMIIDRLGSRTPMVSGHEFRNRLFNSIGLLQEMAFFLKGFGKNG